MAAQHSGSDVKSDREIHIELLFDVCLMHATQFLTRYFAGPVGLGLSFVICQLLLQLHTRYSIYADTGYCEPKLTSVAEHGMKGYESSIRTAFAHCQP